VLIIVLGTYVVRSGLLGGSTRGAVSLQRVASRSSATSADTSATPVEIPTLVGLKVDEATMVLKAAGLTQVIRREAPGRSAEPTVSSQDPAPGALARAGSVVTLILPAASTAKSTVAKAKVRRGAFIVCIDPGHQSHTDSKTEPVGPGSAVRKPRITGGTTGALTGARECETVLQIGINLRRRLEAAGVTVVMTRTTNDVSLSNAERAQIASAAGANLFVRLHADSSTDASLSGVSTLFPSALGWTAPIAAPSKRAASAMQNALVKRTRAVDRGTAERSDLAGFNFSTVPAVLVAVGYPSNRVEDRLLVSPNYQDQVAQGLADGILGYLKSQR
jgi:N-acetylmuramoyl-L-alanine amidase